MKRSILMICAVFLMISGTVLGGWSVTTISDPTSLAGDGVLHKASNFGYGAAAQTIGGISYDIDYSNITNASAVSDSWADKFYSGTDAAINNLMNTGGNVSEWGPTMMTLNLSGLTVGNDYRFQLITGPAWTGAGANLYANGGADYQYVYFADASVNLATYTWTADSTSLVVDTTAGSGEGSYYNLGYAVHDVTSVPEPATLLLLGAGAAAGLRRRKK